MTERQYSKDEQRYLELHKKFQEELKDVENQIDKLMLRRDDLEALLNGTAVIVPEPPVETTSEESADLEDQETAFEEAEMERLLKNLAGYIKRKGGVKRSEIIESWAPEGVDNGVLTRLLERGRRRGLIVSTGSGRGSLWYVPSKLPKE